ncbi:hypothetical protein RADP37_05106 (plasmid) [Roseomonas mucosa]|uniref:Uncharacterized protein n=1 Tax=Roseomonas mucosa TaxID=207340 RepID=A0A4Y1MQD5_9PROT|nr:DUF6270 domain-containing protein [Roseomonas mucosa]AWV20157.1 hypothetical protein RADP37_05106 [Roseomonas mucosa]QDD97129.1 hypothetical protein ADP8_05106 [Roseomonas mucosa]
MISTQAEMTKANIRVLGSCVTRDPLQHIADKINISYYQARTCVTSMMAQPVSLDLPIDNLDAPPFEKRCVVADLEKTWLKNLSEKADLVVLDFIDERFGLARIDDQIFTFSTTLRRMLDSNGRKISDLRFIPPTSIEYKECLRKSLPEFCEKISSIKTIYINDAVWTERKEDGKRFSEEMIAIINDNNAILHMIFEQISKRTKAHFANVQSDLLEAKIGHRWGDAPFHYSDKTEKLIAERLMSYVQEQVKK